ncbi:ATP-binding domain-containing protein [Parapedobacter deserti]|uniref:ATP-binding domain-containing protein n=1 Tax=Parapedobacter deserti TaxID=1912957 RepID=A0ABV7JRU5_9SPHI
MYLLSIVLPVYQRYDLFRIIDIQEIYKAKGKEFDHVFIMLERFIPTTDEAKRQLYVAMTRAKRNLTIHVNADFLDSMTAENLEKVTNG